MTERSWVNFSQDAETGIESIRAHFQGHAYDPHWHDSYLVGFTEQGVQQFRCRKVLHSSTPGKVFLLEPGELHDGHAPAPGGFTYSMLYLDPQWMERELRALFAEVPASAQPSFAATLNESPALLGVIVGLGVGETLVRLPALQTAMSWLGALWLSYLAWQILNSSPSAMAGGAETPIAYRLGLLGAASLQLVNPKTWMMALAVVGVFAGAGADQAEQVMRLSLVFFLVSIPCLGFWACVGLGAAKVVRSARGMRRFNQLMALLLLVSAWLNLLV